MTVPLYPPSREKQRERTREAFAFPMKLILNRMKLKMNLKGSVIAHGCFVSAILKNICFLSKFSAGGLCDWGILLVISLEFQGNKASTVFYGTALFFAFQTMKYSFSAMMFAEQKVGGNSV